MRLYSLRTLVLAAGGLLGSASVLAGQDQTLDEGVFRITRGGQEIGQEAFSIRRTGVGPGATISARGRVALDTAGVQIEQNTTMELAAATLRPTTYQFVQRGPEPFSVAGRLVGNRFTARIVSPAGETMREFIAGPGAVLADERLSHHFHFLGQQLRDQAFQVPLIVPRLSRQFTASVRIVGEESLRIGAATVRTRRVRVDAAGYDSRDVWFDDQGRVVRLAIPARDWVAQRTAPPR